VFSLYLAAITPHPTRIYGFAPLVWFTKGSTVLRP